MNTKKNSCVCPFPVNDIRRTALYEKIVLEECGTVGFLCWY